MSAETRHAHHLNTDGAEVPGHVRESVLSHLRNAGTFAERDEFAAALEALYAAHGSWEDFLRAPTTNQEGR